ncbi:MAG: hypothetical protein KDD15_33875, partial [Lewinella sp.]|nr:hypothetical protein [Lewinella sp.]
AEAYNQVWHVPTTNKKLTNLQWIQLVADELKVEPKIQTVPVWLIKVLGLFIPIMKEFPEMMYQFDQDYVFDSSKFEKRFGMMATLPEDGVRKLIQSITK